MKLNALRSLLTLAVAVSALAVAGGASALPRSQSIAMVPSALGKFSFGVLEMPLPSGMGLIAEGVPLG